MKDKNQSCSNCYFFLQTSQRGTQQIGYCRAAPPASYFETDEQTGLISPKIARFPVVLNNMWCGSWDERDDAFVSCARSAQGHLNLAQQELTKVAANGK